VLVVTHIAQSGVGQILCTHVVEMDIIIWNEKKKHNKFFSVHYPRLCVVNDYLKQQHGTMEVRVGRGTYTINMNEIIMDYTGLRTMDGRL
jgi:hypothetical protein